MANIGFTQLLLVLLIILLLFGGKKLPELAHSLGKSLGEFKKGKEEGDNEAVAARNAAAAPQQQAQIPSAAAPQAPANQAPTQKA